MYISSLSGIIVREFENDPEEWGLIPGHVIPKTQKMVLDSFLFNAHHYKIWIKDRWSNQGKGIVPFPTPQCSSN